MPEIWDIYDERRVRRPYTHVRGEPLRDGDWHLVVEVWSFTPDGRALLTLRHPDKHYGGTWECTGGSAQSGEISIQAVRRELREETGLHMGAAIPTLLCTTLHHHSIVDTYAVTLPFSLQDVTLQEGETVDARLADFAEVDESSLAAPVAERLRIARPLLRRYLDGAERMAMCDRAGRDLGYSRLRSRPDAPTPPFLPGEMCRAAEIWLMDAAGHLLVTRRAPGKSHAGQWECTGGMVRPGESPQAAIVREVREEIGLDLAGATLQPLARLADVSFSGPCLIDVFGARADFSLADLRLDPAEVSDARLLPLEEISGLALQEGVRINFERVRDALRRMAG